MSNWQPIGFGDVLDKHLPHMSLTHGLGEALPTSQRLPQAQFQCNCDCACSIGGQSAFVTLSGPVTCYLELTPACTNLCPGCGNVFIDRQTPVVTNPPLSLKQWEIVLDKISPWVNLLKLTGGEPTLYQDFFPLLHILHSKDIPFALLTSGRWPKPRLLLDELEKCPSFRGFLISLHGPNAQVHEAFTTTPGSFADAASAIQAATRAGFSVTVSTVMVHPNLGHFQDTVETALGLGADHVIFGRYIGEPRPGLTLSEEEFLQAIWEVQALESQGLPVRFGNCIPQCFEPSSSRGCTAGRSFCTVDPWANVRPCNHARLVAGNLLEQSLEDIWWSEPMAQWRQVSSPDCLRCQAYSHCHGGCRALSYGRDGDPLMKEPLQSAPLILQPPAQLALYAHAIPESRYQSRQEPFGPVLACDGQVMPISSNILTFLEHVDRRCTLAQIQDKYGDQALSFVGGLYLQRFLSLCVPDTIPL